MTLDIAILRKAIAKKGYTWYEDKPNIIGIRSSLNVPDIFNDILAIVYKDKGVEKLYTATITTEPGVAYQKKLLNPKGCWVMMPAQMVDAYSPGFHQGKPDHRCLRSTGKIYGLRDANLDGIAGNSGEGFWAEGTKVGANIHGANKAGITKQIGPWSAGCQVHNDWKKKEEMMDICEKLYPKLKKFTYTLLLEKDLK
jgi:hypothetical protein